MSLSITLPPTPEPVPALVYLRVVLVREAIVNVPLKPVPPDTPLTVMLSPAAYVCVVAVVIVTVEPLRVAVVMSRATPLRSLQMIPTPAPLRSELQSVVCESQFHW